MLFFIGISSSYLLFLEGRFVFMMAIVELLLVLGV